MSDVWKTFNKSTLKDGKVQCSICCEWISAAGGTTNLRNHLKRKHPFLTSPCISNSSSSMNSIENHFTMKVGEKTQEKFNCAVAKYIAKDFRPLSTIESPAFREMIHIANPRIQVPGRKAMKTILRGLQDGVITDIKNEIKIVKALSLTTDTWTSVSQCAYLSLTVHYITEQWEFVSRLLCAREISGNHTGKNIGQLLRQLLSEWEINSNQVVAVDTDNARNMNVAAAEAGLRKQPCFAHSIQLSVMKGVDIVSELNFIRSTLQKPLLSL